MAHAEVVKLGGLHIIGTERHESRRIDNQLRGRAGRQGDPGSSRFFLGLDDDIMRLFGGDQVSKLMTFFNIPEDHPLEHGMVSRAIEQAQSKVEQFNFDSRKHLLDYDDVMNKQREIIYTIRRKVLNPDYKKVSRGETLQKIDKEIEVLSVKGGSFHDEGDLAKIVDDFSTIIPFDENSKKAILEQMTKAQNQEPGQFLQKIARDVYAQREKQMGEEITRYIEQQEMLRVVDILWMEHLESIDDLREGIGLRGYGQRDPLVEYKSEAFNMFERLMGAIDSEIVHRVFKVAVAVPNQVEKIQRTVTNASQIENNAANSSGKPDPSISKPLDSARGHRPGRNDPCWCGSGKKYKRCHYPN